MGAAREKTWGVDAVDDSTPERRKRWRSPIEEHIRTTAYRVMWRANAANSARTIYEAGSKRGERQ